MNGNFNLLWRDKLIRLTLLLSIVLSVATTILIALFYHKLPPLVPFFNSMPWGRERLAPVYYIGTLPLVFLIVLILNNFMSIAIYQSHTLLARILSMNGFLFVLFGFLAYLQILFLVF